MPTLWTTRFDRRASVRTPDNLIRCSFDLFAVDKVFALLVSRKIDYPIPLLTHPLRDRKQNSVAQSAAGEKHILIGFDFGWRAGRTHHNDRLARLQIAAQAGRDSQLERDQ